MSTPQNNFQIFNENNNQYTTMSDEEYASLDYRFNGLIPMIADPIAHNKMFRQWSIMAKAVADMICDKGYDALDTDATDLKNNLKTSVKDLARDELQSDITTNANNITTNANNITALQTGKADIGHTHLTADITDITATSTEINTLHGITASTAELNYSTGVTSNIQTQLTTLQTGKADIGHTHLIADITDITATSTEINYLSGANSNIQQQINNLAISAFIPLRQNSTPYAVGDVVKIAGLSIFQYLECIATGTSASSLPLFNRTTGHATQDGTAIWLVCDMRDGLQAGDMKYRFTNNDLAGYIKDNQTILYFDKQTPIENAYNWRLLRLFRLILNQALLQYIHPSLFLVNVIASPNTASTNPVLLYGAGVVIINQWCNLTPTNLTTIDDITLQDYIDISTYNTNNSVSYTESQYKQTAQTLLNDILAGSGAIIIRVSDIRNKYIKLQHNTDWISRLEDEGLPDITGGLGSLVSGSNNNTNPSNGALSWGGRGNANKYQIASSATSNLWYDPIFKASNSNAIYGNNSHVIPASLHLCPFIKY